MFFEQLAEGDILYFPCRHYIYDLVLHVAFECKSSYKIFTQLREKWRSIDKDKINDEIFFLNEVCAHNEIKDLTDLFQKTLREGCFLDDCFELLEW